MCGVIVVDAGMSRSTCLGRDITPSMRLYLPRVEARLIGITALKAMLQVR